MSKDLFPMFQFLIGRLETLCPSLRLVWSRGFQFLIGRLETHGLHLSLLFMLPFQFLIGRLETALNWIETKESLRVSIPHR